VLWGFQIRSKLIYFRNLGRDPRSGRSHCSPYVYESMRCCTCSTQSRHLKKSCIHMWHRLSPILCPCHYKSVDSMETTSYREVIRSIPLDSLHAGTR
jgi:hypothetical protein